MLKTTFKGKITAAIFGCEGLELSKAEIAFFAAKKPLGFILFKRNIDTPEQVKALVAALRAAAGHPHVLILIDQEGGRVQRLKPPHWPTYPPAATFGDVTESVFEHRELVRLGARLMAHDLAALGINVDCVPVLDVPQPNAHDIIGDRAYGDTAETVATMGRAACEGLLAGGVLPVIKHIPGHGRALADSHHDLPVVKAKREELDTTDFYPFAVNADMPLAMTAHVVYAAIDRRNPATTSKKVIKVIRQDIGFDGLLMCDDLSMGALKGTFAHRTKSSLRAGCDVVLHCNGNMDEMQQVAAATPVLKGKALERAMSAVARLKHVVEPLDVNAARTRLSVALRRKVATVREDYEGYADPTVYQVG
ncbi:beta-N-acetylhexosaminidase [Asticcacaulis sp. BYS171W]|uniref:beta-N-acetylhexosaminidase n=1 Tax=Asticcacaulis aquaticus TaxID=2984212 RepID=A0ABT5HXU6_9CAUL|nr:beta-N-acetylhexosaminidase [Asticcacaulis aquaticus]